MHGADTTTVKTVLVENLQQLKLSYVETTTVSPVLQQLVQY